MGVEMKLKFNHAAVRADAKIMTKKEVCDKYQMSETGYTYIVKPRLKSQHGVHYKTVLTEPEQVRMKEFLWAINSLWIKGGNAMGFITEWREQYGVK